jgi:hypothetical protein
VSVVDAERLHSYLSMPRWTPEQWQEAAALVEEIEAELSAALGGPPITPVGPLTETVDVTDGGLLLVRWPVHRPTKLDGVALAEDDPLPAGWSLTAGYLTDRSRAYTPRYNRVTGTAELEYWAGWGPLPVLRSALLRKLRSIWINRHANEITARDANGEAPRPLPENWTDSEIKRLSIYYWHSVA